MIVSVYPVFERNGEEYVADTRMVLTSNPPQYNAYRLKDKRQTYVFCSEANAGKKVMYESDFIDFMYGKSNGTLVVSRDGTLSVPITNISSSASVPISSEVPIPITYIREKSTHERVEDLEKEVKRLSGLVRKITKK